MDSQTNVYLNYYKAQSGGRLSGFVGNRSSSQTGAGLGDILRGIFRTIFPIAARCVSTFLNETLKAKDGGSDWGSAAKAAIAPATKEVASGALSEISKRLSNNQNGSGRRGRRRSRRVALRKTGSSSSTQGKEMSGGGSSRGYKRRRSTPSRTRKTHFKRIKFLNF